MDRELKTIRAEASLLSAVLIKEGSTPCPWKLISFKPEMSSFITATGIRLASDERQSYLHGVLNSLCLECVYGFYYPAQDSTLGIALTVAEREKDTLSFLLCLGTMNTYSLWLENEPHIGQLIIRSQIC